MSTSSNLPDIEDANRDNTLSEGESYYEYKISIRPEDIENREKYQDAEVLETEAAVEQDQETLQRISEAQ